MNQINNEPYMVEEIPVIPQKPAHRGKGLRVLSVIWNAVTLAFSALCLLFLPVSLLIGIVIAVLGSIGVLVLALPLAMTILVVPFLPLIVALAIFLLMLGVIALAHLPLVFGVVGLILSVAAFRKGKKHGDGKKAMTLSLILGIADPILAVAASGACLMSSMTAFTPLFLLAVLCLFYFVQMIVIAIGNAAV